MSPPICIRRISVEMISPNLELDLNNAIKWIYTKVDKYLEWKMKSSDFYMYNTVLNMFLKSYSIYKVHEGDLYARVSKIWHKNKNRNFLFKLKKE